MPEAIRVAIADDQRLMREGLRTLLELEEGLEVVGEAADGRSAVDLAAECAPDVILMDVRMPGVDGVGATRTIRARLPSVRVLVLTTFDDDAYVYEALRAGASGYLLKDVSRRELAAAIRSVATGGAVIGSAVADKVLTRFSRLAPEDGGARDLIEPLSDRELEILALVADGLSNSAIGMRVGLAEGTVKNYVSSILQKTGTGDRTSAALRGRELGLI